MGLTFDTSTSLFECVDVGVNTTFTVQLVPSQVPRQEALLEEEKNCSRTVLGISDKSMELTCCAMMRSSSGPTDASCQLQPPCSLPQGWQGPTSFFFSSEVCYPLFSHLHVAEGEEMHKSFGAEVWLVLRGFKVPIDQELGWCKWRQVGQVLSRSRYGTYLMISLHSSTMAAPSFCSFWRKRRRSLGDILPGVSLVYSANKVSSSGRSSRL